ncbi:dual specificity protein phosphatase 15 [Platysternon megacephalum]|uniref:Dual specificity protein phosphatase 15 n=1 Tax=Platysternon megacephalum TaxID=55544 RepID=A0A4D9E1X1_9SAUR|nr:dual specificity protein phosphatase 15 [Platysternon megacephalum]
MSAPCVTVRPRSADFTDTHRFLVLLALAGANPGTGEPMHPEMEVTKSPSRVGGDRKEEGLKETGKIMRGEELPVLPSPVTASSLCRLRGARVKRQCPISA